MAASNQAVSTYQWTVQQIREMLFNPMFLSSNSFTFKGEFPTFNGTVIQFTHGVSFSSWGENIQITITVNPGNSNYTDVFVRSECSMPTQIVDWGKNQENLNKIFTYLNQFVPVTPVQAPAAAFCTSCGTALTPGAMFCTACGMKV